MDKIIFLDVDGVLNCTKTWQGPHKDGVATLDPVLCDRLETIVEQTNAIVVLSSTWRLAETRGFIKLRVWLMARGITIHSCTPDLSHEVGWGTKTRADRGDEIALWLENYENECNYVILDDDSDMLPSQKPYFVHTSFKDGLTERHANKAIKILKQS